MATNRLQPITPEDLYRLRALSDFVLSPDGCRLAAVISSIDHPSHKAQTNLWLAPALHGQPQQFTFGNHHDSHPCFSPDGKLLAFLSDRSGSNQVHLMRVTGGESWQLSKVAGGVCDFTWAPDGRRLCITVMPATNAKDQPAPLSRHFTGYRVQPPAPVAQLQMLDAKTGRTKLLSKDEFSNHSATFTPDGQWIVFCSNKQPDRDLRTMQDDIWKIPADGSAKPQLIKTHPGAAHAPAVSPDGKWIAFRGIADPDAGWNSANLDLWVVPFNGGVVRNLSGALDRMTINVVLSDSFALHRSGLPVWSPDSRSLYSLVTAGGQVKIFRFSMDDRPSEAVVDEPGASLSFQIDFAHERILYLHSDIHSPGDLYIRPLQGGHPRLRQRVNPWIAQRDLGQLHELNCPATKSAPALEGWALVPPGFSPRRKYPGILYIHGGPYSAYGPVFVHEFHYLAGLGYVVFFCNPRGSHGYGVKFVSAIAHDWGNLDYQDLMRFTDYALAQCPYIDPARVGVTGGSYGGYMTNWIIGHTHRFKAAVTQRGISNMLSWLGSMPYPFITAHYHSLTGQTQEQIQAGLIRQSPLTHLVHAKTPTLITHAENDSLTAPEQAQQIYVLFKMLGVETEYVRFPEEGHELSRSGRTDRRIERLKCISGWFDRYLKHTK